MESFFGIGIPELVLILVIAGIVMGPERIGVIARWLGKTTSQLQAISRGFVKQLNSELDGLQDTNEIRGAIQDMQDLRSQIEDLKKELLSVTDGAVKEGKNALAQTQEELRRTIAPPDIVQTEDPPSAHDKTPNEMTPVEELPKRLEIPDDPEP